MLPSTSWGVVIETSERTNSFNDLKINELNQINDFYWLHSINKIISYKSNFFNIFDLGRIGI